MQVCDVICCPDGMTLKRVSIWRLQPLVIPQPETMWYVLSSVSSSVQSAASQDGPRGRHPWCPMHSDFWTSTFVDCAHHWILDRCNACSFCASRSSGSRSMTRSRRPRRRPRSFDCRWGEGITGTSVHFTRKRSPRCALEIRWAKLKMSSIPTATSRKKSKPIFAKERPKVVTFTVIDDGYITTLWWKEFGIWRNQKVPPMSPCDDVKKADSWNVKRRTVKTNVRVVQETWRKWRKRRRRTKKRNKSGARNVSGCRNKHSLNKVAQLQTVKMLEGRQSFLKTWQGQTQRSHTGDPRHPQTYLRQSWICPCQAPLPPHETPMWPSRIAETKADSLLTTSDDDVAKDPFKEHVITEILGCARRGVSTSCTW